MFENEDVEQVSSPAEESETPVKEESVQSPSESLPDKSTEQSGQVPPVKKDTAGEVNYEEIARHVTRFLAPQLKQQVEERLSQFQTAQPQTAPQAQPNTWQAFFNGSTDEQIESWADTNTEYRSQARAELNRRIEERTEQRVLSKLKNETTRQSVEREKQEALSYVVQTYNEAFIDSPTGKAWNMASPLYQKAMQIYNSRDSFKNDGMGLAGAFDMAYAQLAREEKQTLMKQKTKVTAEQRKAEKKVLSGINAGNASAPAEVSASKQKLDKLKEQYAKTRDVNTLTEIIKLKGLMPKFD